MEHKQYTGETYRIGKQFKPRHALGGVTITIEGEPVDGMLVDFGKMFEGSVYDCTAIIEFDFCAGHHLPKSLVGEGHKCARPHGHNYLVEVEFKTNTGAVSNLVADSDDIQQYLDNLIDHRNINKIYHYMATTAENLAKELLDHIRGRFDAVRLRLYETPNCWVEITPGDEDEQA